MMQIVALRKHTRLNGVIDIDFIEGDGEALPYPELSFDGSYNLLMQEAARKRSIEFRSGVFFASREIGRPQRKAG